MRVKGRLEGAPVSAQTHLVVIRGGSFCFGKTGPGRARARVGGKGRLQGLLVLAQTRVVVTLGRSFCFGKKGETKSKRENDNDRENKIQEGK